MRIAILTFDAFNDLDSLVAFGMLNRIALLGDRDWQVHIASPTPHVPRHVHEWPDHSRA